MTPDTATLTGLPDFQYPLRTSDLEVYAPFGTGAYALLPRAVGLARKSDGTPDFQLMLMKRAGDTTPSGQYGVMDISLAGDYPSDDALVAVRSSVPAARVVPAALHSGYVRLYPTNDAAGLPADIAAPVALGWAGANFARWTLRLSLDSAELIRGAILGSTLLFGARIEFDVIGIAPRVPVLIQFEPAKLVSALCAESKGKPGDPIPATAVPAAFLAAGGLPFQVVGNVPDIDVFARAMADRIIATYGALVPAPDVTSPPFVSLNVANPDGAIIQWDLNQPALGVRQWSMLLDPLTAVRSAAAASGPGKLVSEVAIPPLDLGFVGIDFLANLPANRIGIPAIGVNVQIPANPPGRPAAENATVIFTRPDDKGTASLRLGPDEPLSYSVTGFAMISTGHSAHRFEAPQFQMNQPWLQLQPAHFPVRFAHLTAAARLLSVASIQGVLTYTWNGKVQQQPFALSAAQPDLSVAAPSAAQDATLSISAIPLNAAPASNAGSLPLPPIKFQATSRVDLDFTTFPGYGPHTITIQCAMNVGDAPVFLEFLPEQSWQQGSSSDPVAAPAKFVFTPEQPANRWGYVALSPFRSGFRFRQAAAQGEAAKPWSDVQMPSGTLLLDAKGAIGRAGSPLATAAG